MKKQYQNQRVTVYESALFRTTSTIVSLPEATILVDPNWLPVEIGVLREHITQYAGKKLYLLFTHSDYDHIIGYRAFSAAKVVASRAFQDNSDQKKIIQQILQFDDEYYIKRDYPIEYPTVDVLVDEEDQVFDLGSHQIHFRTSPGHNRDGIFSLIEPEGILIAGDYLSNIEFPYIYHNIADYHQSLTKAEEWINAGRVKLLIPGHGDCTEDIAEMKKRISDSRDYLHQLASSVQSGEDFKLQDLWAQYEFPGIMAKFHQANVELARKELLA